MPRLIMAVFVLLTGMACGPSYDKEGLDRVNAYADDIIPAMDAAVLGLGVWAEAQGSPEATRRLGEHVTAIRVVNETHWTEAFPNKQDVEGWTVKVDRDGEEWFVTGEDLAEAIWAVESSSSWLADELERLFVAGENWDAGHLQQVGRAVEDAIVTVPQLRRVLYDR